jgi:hypothetical protein
MFYDKIPTHRKKIAIGFNNESLFERHVRSGSRGVWHDASGGVGGRRRRRRRLGMDQCRCGARRRHHFGEWRLDNQSQGSRNDGGRVAIYYNELQRASLQISAAGGRSLEGTAYGTAGTIFLSRLVVVVVDG